MSAPESAPNCTGNPTTCSFCSPSQQGNNQEVCAVKTIPGCTSVPENCPVCGTGGSGCVKECAGDPTNCSVCKEKCIKPAEATFGIEPARPK